MKLTKSQKVWLGVLGAGVAVLAADRLTTHAADADTPEDPGERAVAPAVVPGRSADAAETPTLAARLAALNENGTAADAFAPSPAWTAATRPPADTTGERSEKFRAAHRLRAVVRSPGGDRALVDNDLLAVGDTFDGWRLAEVREFAACFVGDGVRADLTLDSVPAAMQRRIGPGIRSGFPSSPGPGVPMQNPAGD